jgi:hypothetical protein
MSPRPADPTFRDVYKTVGKIRAAAARLCEALRKDGGVLYDMAAELHDSICRALPADPDTPARTTEVADSMLLELQHFVAPYAGYTHAQLEHVSRAPPGDRGLYAVEPDVAASILSMRGIIADATGARPLQRIV